MGKNVNTKKTTQKVLRIDSSNVDLEIISAQYELAYTLCSRIRITYRVKIRQLLGQLTDSSKMWQSLNYVRVRARNHNYSTFRMKVIAD
jgi:hypothetical protein